MSGDRRGLAASPRFAKEADGGGDFRRRRRDGDSLMRKGVEA
jgi:hypothetical protein